jgi:ORF6C domain
MDEQRELAIDIPEEQASQQALIPLLDDELTAAMTTAGNIFVSVPGICKALGLNARPQLLRLQRTYCLRVDRVALWLAGMETTRIKDETLRAKIEYYQDELVPVATEVFMRVVGLAPSHMIPTHDPGVLALAEQIDTLTDVAHFLREHMQGVLEAQGQVSLQLEKAVQLLEALTSRQESTETRLAKIDERTQRLTPTHVGQVQVQVEQLARAMTQRQSRLSLAQAHALIYGRLKMSFQVGSYKETPDERFEEIMRYLRDELQQVLGGRLPEQSELF